MIESIQIARCLLAEAAGGTRRSTRLLTVALGLAASLSFLPSVAVAGAGEVATVVTRLSDVVTYRRAATSSSAALETFIGYSVAVSNVGGNTVNNIVFTGGVTRPGDSANLPTFSTAEGALCQATNAAGTQIACSLGQVRAGESAPVFQVFFRSPLQGNAAVPGDPANCAATDCVTFSGATYYAEGAGGYPQSTPDNSVRPWPSVNVALGTVNLQLVRSIVPRVNNRYEIATGNGGVSTTTDRFATTVAIQATNAYTTAKIEEALASAACNNFLACYQSDIAIPVPSGATQFSPYLEILLRVHSSNILPGTKIGSVVIYYDGAAVGQCASATTPRTDFQPCIAESGASKDKVTGGFWWKLLNLRNGSYRIQ